MKATASRVSAGKGVTRGQGKSFLERLTNVVFVITAPAQRFVDSLAPTSCEMKASWFIRLQVDGVVITTSFPGQ